jgi:hypothetical protein
VRLGTPKTPGPYGLEPAARWDFLSADEVAGQGISLLPAATPPSVNQGLVLNGTSQYVTVPLAWITQAFRTTVPGAAGPLSVFIEFFPDFNYTEDVIRFLMDSTGNRQIVLKGPAASSYALDFYFGATTFIGQVLGAVYGPLWRTGGKNRLCLALTSGANNFYFNGSLIGSSVTAWAISQPTVLYLGSSIVPSDYFDGTITDFALYPRQLTAAEAIQLTTVA